MQDPPATSALRSLARKLPSMRGHGARAGDAVRPATAEDGFNSEGEEEAADLSKSMRSHSSSVVAFETTLRNLLSAPGPIQHLVTSEFKMLECKAYGGTRYVSLKRKDIVELAQAPSLAAYGKIACAPQARDWRSLDPEFTGLWSEPAVIVRALAVFISLEPIRALLLPDCVLLLVSETSPEGFCEALSRKILAPPRSIIEDEDDGEVSKEQPFEMLVMETFLSELSITIERELQAMDSRVHASIAEALDDSSSVGLDKITLTRRDHGLLYSRVSGLRKAINDLLSSDHDLTMLNFTYVQSHPAEFPNGEPIDNGEGHVAHEDVELVVEPYLLDIDATLVQVELLKADLDSAEVLIRQRLDAARNRLLWIDIQLNVVMAVTITCGMIKDIFQMNLSTTVFTVPYLFWAIAGLLVIGGLLTILGVLYYLAQRGYKVE